MRRKEYMRIYQKKQKKRAEQKKEIFVMHPSEAALPLWKISLGGLKLSAVDTFSNYDTGCKNL
jgi:hypothetical protein